MDDLKFLLSKLVRADVLGTPLQVADTITTVEITKVVRWARDHHIPDEEIVQVYQNDLSRLVPQCELQRDITDLARFLAISR